MVGVRQALERQASHASGGPEGADDLRRRADQRLLHRVMGVIAVPEDEGRDRVLAVDRRGNEL